MRKYKAGDKIVLEILQENYGDYKVGDETDAWWISSNHIEATAEPLSEYTDPLNDKISRQADEITRLLRENAELKKGRESIRDNAFEAGLIRGQQEAWELARKCMLMTDRERESIFGSGHNALYGVLTYFDYQHAAAKVAEWERKKEEICVGDVVKIHEGNENDICVICISSDKKYYNAIDKYGALYPMLTRETISKTGRHIDVDAWLAQIGGER